MLLTEEEFESLSRLATKLTAWNLSVHGSEATGYSSRRLQGPRSVSSNRLDGGLLVMPRDGYGMSVAQAQTVLEKIRTRGYWRVVIRPGAFEEKRIPNYSDLFQIVEKNSVRLRGWDYPHVDYHRQPQCGTDWVGQEYDCQDEIEVWRAFT